MSGIPLQPGIIYGPILSRRLGRSLGVNLLPANRKICSFDCIYCQYGHTHDLMISPERSMLPNASDVLMAVEAALKKPRTIDYITFSGNGEPTIHPDFPEIVRGVKGIQTKLRPDAKLGILSNSSRVTDPEITAALRLLDAPMMKLDAGDEDTFEAINHPVGRLTIAEIVEGLKTLPNLMVQSALIDGEVSNIRGSAYNAWVERLVELKPRIVHIYSTERPTAQSAIKCVSPKKLQSIAKQLNDEYDLNVHGFWQD